jgi:hypothetical protein
MPSTKVTPAALAVADYQGVTVVVAFVAVRLRSTPEADLLQQVSSATGAQHDKRMRSSQPGA